METRYAKHAVTSFFIAFLSLESNALDAFTTSAKYSQQITCGQFDQIQQTIQTGTEPFFIAFSPLFNNNLFAAVTNFGASPGSVSVYTVSNSGIFAPVASSPFQTGPQPFSVAFSPVFEGNLFAAVTNFGDTSVSVYSVNNSGIFTPVLDSPFPMGGDPFVVAFSPIFNGKLFAAVTYYDSPGFVAVYSVASNGVFTQVADSPFSTGNYPLGVAFSPLYNGKLFAAVTNTTDGTVSLYSVSDTGFFTPIATTGMGILDPYSVAFSPVFNGKIFAAVANNGGGVAVFSVNDSGLTPIAGSPFSTGSQPYSVAFSPLINCNLYAAVANKGDNNLSVYSVSDTGIFTLIGSPSPGPNPVYAAFSPQVDGTIFAAAVNQGDDSVTAYNTHISGPLATLTVDTTTVCLGTPVTFTIDVTGGAMPMVEFNNTMYTSFPAVVQLTPPLGTTAYQVTNVTDSNGCSCNNGVSNSVNVTARQCATLEVKKCCQNKNGCITFTISITNTSNVPANNVFITDTLADCFEFVSASGTYVVSGQTVTTTVSVPAGETVIFTINAKMRKRVKNTAFALLDGEIIPYAASCCVKLK